MKHTFELESFSFKETGLYSKLIDDYSEKKPTLKHLIDDFPSQKSLLLKAKKRVQSFLNRSVLCDVLKDQYSSLNLLSGPIESRIQLLSKDHTYTLCTGHQLNIFGGPLYMIYKIIDVIIWAKRMNQSDDTSQYLPIFWLASEDHDFEEIAYCHVLGNKIEWKTSQSGAVGRMSLNDFSETLEKYTISLGLGKAASDLKKLFTNAYTPNRTLSEATRYWITTFFNETDLLVIDGDDKQLKSLFKPIMKMELEEAFVKNEGLTSQKFLNENYHVQVNPRETNLFYINENGRHRIEANEKGFTLVDEDVFWTKEAFWTVLEDYPERFSPNALMRPMYQEWLLPNIAYFGGGAEIAYWMQLKQVFERASISFPILLVRNSWHFVDENDLKKLKKLGVEGKRLFEDRNLWESRWVSEMESAFLHLEAYQSDVNKAIEGLKNIVDDWEHSIVGSVEAEQQKMKKALLRLRKKMVRAGKKKQALQIDKYHHLMDKIFQPNSLQERYDNFANLYLFYGKEFIDVLMRYSYAETTNFKLIKVHSQHEKP